MKLKNYLRFSRFEGETIATFGTARLVRKLNGDHELIGGSAEQHAAAREWCSLFAPQIVFKNYRRSLSSVTPISRFNALPD